jgi:hypothetical protein
MNPTLAQFILARPFGFVTEADMPQLIALDRLCPLVVRCGCCRFICGAQDLATLLGYVRKAGDYCRDVSIHPETIAIAKKQKPEPKPLTELWRRRLDEFNEADCGGVFDGRQVTSDADPGL